MITVDKDVYSHWFKWPAFECLWWWLWMGTWFSEQFTIKQSVLIWRLGVIVVRPILWEVCDADIILYSKWSEIIIIMTTIMLPVRSEPVTLSYYFHRIILCQTETGALICRRFFTIVFKSLCLLSIHMWRFMQGLTSVKPNVIGWHQTWCNTSWRAVFELSKTEQEDFKWIFTHVLVIWTALMILFCHFWKNHN